MYYILLQINDFYKESLQRKTHEHRLAAAVVTQPVMKPPNRTFRFSNSKCSSCWLQPVIVRISNVGIVIAAQLLRFLLK